MGKIDIDSLSKYADEMELALKTETRPDIHKDMVEVIKEIRELIARNS